MFIRLMEQAKDVPALQFKIDKREGEREITSNSVKVTRAHINAQIAPDTKHNICTHTPNAPFFSFTRARQIKFHNPLKVY